MPLRWVSRHLLDVERAALVVVRSELNTATIRAKEWKKQCVTQLATVRRQEGEIAALQRRAESAEAAYRGLVDKMLTPPVAPPATAPIDPDTQGLTAISEDTIKRMTEQFVRDGLSPEVAEAHARELVNMAERGFGAVD